MQRWIVAGAGVLILLMGGLLFAYQSYKQNRPSPMWVPLPINPELTVSKREEVAKELKTKLADQEILLRVCKDLSLKQKWNLGSDEAAAGELGRRLFVRPGDAVTEMGNVPAIHIGINGKAKESQLSGAIAMRLMDDVWKILGIKPPNKKAI